MERKLFEKHLNKLTIISENFTYKHQSEYKLHVLKNSLETLQSANIYVEIPYELLEKVDKIFKLIPKHERYFVEINQAEHQEYLKLIKELDEIFVKKYIGKVNEIKKHLKTLVSNLSSIFFIYWIVEIFFENQFEYIEKSLKYISIIFIVISIALFTYQRIKWLKMRYSKIY
jgi:hypothetical protein